MTVAGDVDALAGDLVALRRRLHLTPEIGLHLPRTQGMVVDALDGLGMDVTVGRALSSVTAVLRGARPGPVVLLRSDMDALPIHEETGLPFAADGGAMHACGHDLHMAGLVGAARLLAARRAALAGTVVFMFQPGEEGYAGARAMIDEGVLDAGGARPVASYALHVDCVTDRGVVVTRPGTIMASVSALSVRISASGGHASSPHLGIDPVPVAAEIILAMQSFVARRVPAADPAVVSVARITSDSPASNVLSTVVALDVNVRTLSRETLDLVRTGLVDLIVALAEAHGCRAACDFVTSYPVTVNDPVETERALATVEGIPGMAGVRRLAAPAMASEDFAYVLEEVPGTLLFLGAMAAGSVDAAPMHSSRAVFDDSVLPLQAEILAELAWRRLAAEEHPAAAHRSAPQEQFSCGS